MSPLRWGERSRERLHNRLEHRGSSEPVHLAGELHSSPLTALHCRFTGLSILSSQRPTHRQASISIHSLFSSEMRRHAQKVQAAC